jgi:hypothetical protein
MGKAPIGKRNFGVTIGIVTGLIANMLILQIGMTIYPPPADLDTNDVEAMTRFIESMPLGQLLFTYAAHISQAGVGAVAGCLSNRQKASRTGMLVGGITATFCMMNLMMVPHPMWFWSELPMALVLGWGIGRIFQTP